ncbi:MAG: adenylate/guanylate cyclase domain-containing protein [Gemmatirosa sp.]
MSFHLVDAHGTRLAGLPPGGGALVVGRSAECSLILSDPTVSRRHAEVHAVDDHLVVMDLGSRNGTFRNGVRVERARLRPGDVVAFGVVSLRVEGGEAQQEQLAMAAERGAVVRETPLSEPESSIEPPPALYEATSVSPPDPAGESLPLRATPSLDGPAVAGTFREPRLNGAAAESEVERSERAVAEAPPIAGATVQRPIFQVPAVEAAPAASLAVPPAVSESPDGEPPIFAEREAASPQELTARRLQQLLEATKALGGATDVAAVHERIVGAALRTLDADRAAILLTDDDDGSLLAVVARDRWGADLIAAGAPPVPRTITRTALARRSALLTVDATADPRFVGQSVLRQRVRSAMCVPLLDAEGSALGALYVDSADPHRQFAESDLDFLTAFGALAASSLENARLAERVRREAVARENFSRYFAPPVAERIARSSEPARLGGERRTVAVLFADLRGFTRLSATLQPDELAETLSDFLSGMVDCVFRHGGTLDKFIGDCVMAQWGAPESGADDADRALSSAIDMLGTVDALNVRRVADGREPLAIGIGIAFGEVFAGNIGSDRRLEFTVIGDVVNLASRLCDAAGPGQILLADPLRQALRRAAPRMREVEGICAPAEPGQPAPPTIFVVARTG